MVTVVADLTYTFPRGSFIEYFYSYREGADVRGRPRIAVDIEEVEFLRSLRFRWNQVASILGVSRSTLYRRMREEGIREDLQFSDISDEDLDAIVTEIKAEHPNDGEVLLAGHMAVRNICVQRTRLRASIHRVDPIGVEQRRRTVIIRRVYSVGEPNEVWHIDGHHKLIRWRMVVHGGVDGYSRMIMFLQLSTNNCASTVLSVYTEAVGKFGLPQKVRSDLGGENVDVWRYMIARHGDERAVITGSSVHNERIERMWRDVFRCVGKLFYDVFYTLEDEGVLDPLNEIDIFCLHTIFVPRINKCLHDFAECWNHHRMSSAQNFTPFQMFVSCPRSAPRGIASSLTQVRIPQHWQVSDVVSLPRSRFQPCAALKRHIESSINPLQPCNDLGIHLYKDCAALVGDHVMLCMECMTD